jgi:hypothetical protein
LAGRIEACGTMGAFEADHALRGAQVIEHAVGEQAPDQGMAVRPDALALAQAVLRIGQRPGQGIGRDVIAHGRSATRRDARMAGDQFGRAIQVHQLVRSAQPQALAHEAERHRVQRAVELHVAIAVHADLGPGRKLRRDRGQAHEQAALGTGELFQRLTAGGAVAARAGRAEHPGVQLAIGIGQVAEGAQWHPAALDVLHARLDDALLLRIARRTGGDLEAIAFRTIGVGALYGRIGVAGARDRALGIVDDDPPWHAAEPLEGAPMAAQPRGHALVAHEFGVLVARPAQGHDEDPGLERLAGAHIHDLRPGTEVDLRGFARREVQARGGAHRRLGARQGAHEAAHGRVAAGIPVALEQGRVHRRGLHPFGEPRRDHCAQRLERRYAGGCPRPLVQHGRQRGVIGQGLRRIQPTLGLCHGPQHGRLGPPHQLRPRDVAIGIALAHAHQGLAILKHLESPSAHRTLPAKRPRVRRWSSRPDQPPPGTLNHRAGGSITAVMEWLHYGDPGVAPLRRS